MPLMPPFSEKHAFNAHIFRKVCLQCPHFQTRMPLMPQFSDKYAFNTTFSEKYAFIAPIFRKV